MKLTINKIIWIANRVIYYSELLKIEAPYIMTTMQEYNEWKEGEREREFNLFKRVGRSSPGLLGVCHNEDRFIVVLVKRFNNLARLDETIRHELLHYAKSSYNHKSREFWERMKALKNGNINENGRFKIKR